MGGMLDGKRIAVVLPAYNAARTLEKTVAEIPKDIVDTILLVDDFSKDETVEIARRLGLQIYLHERNFGYGRNQKTCYTEALRLNADIVVMLHPDYQYPPRLVLPLTSLIASGTYDVVVTNFGRAGSPWRHACLQVRRQSISDSGAEPVHGSQAVGISLRLSSLFSRCATVSASFDELR
jgi:glycosyltransferase involved in cell wall biosynthesis